MTAGSTRRKPALTRDHLVQSIGRDVSRFQDSSNAFDDVAAEVLGVDRRDLSCMTELLFRGPSTAGELAELLSVARSAVLSTLERLQLAGYARVQPGDGKRVELSEHARPWIERIWSPLWVEGQRALDGYSTRQLEAISFFASQACEIQESRAKRLRTWLAISSSHVRRPHLRGGLSPAALRRVQVFVEGNLGRPIYLRDLAARVGLSAGVQDVNGDDAACLCRAATNRTGEAVADGFTAVTVAGCGGGRIRNAEPLDVDLEAPHRLHARGHSSGSDLSGSVNYAG